MERKEKADPWIPEHPNLHLSPEERRYFGQLFAAADTDKIGVVTGEVAVKFFEKTKLSPTVLGEVRKRKPNL
jgi:epidermal growth factor receptor substrate 15